MTALLSNNSNIEIFASLFKNIIISSSKDDEIPNGPGLNA
jgi:hypothetical protein